MQPATQALMDQVHRHTGCPVTTDPGIDLSKEYALAIDAG